MKNVISEPVFFASTQFACIVVPGVGSASVEAVLEACKHRTVELHLGGDDLARKTRVMPGPVPRVTRREWFGNASLIRVLSEFLVFLRKEECIPDSHLPFARGLVESTECCGRLRCPRSHRQW